MSSNGHQLIGDTYMGEALTHRSSNL